MFLLLRLQSVPFQSWLLYPVGLGGMDVNKCTFMFPCCFLFQHHCACKGQLVLWKCKGREGSRGVLRPRCGSIALLPWVCGTTPSGPQQAMQLAPVRSGYGSPRQPLGHLEFSTLLGIY